MITYKTIKEGLIITKTFGFKHGFNRFKDLIIIKKYNHKNDKLYDKIKPQGFVVKNIMENKMQLDMNDYGIHKELFLYGTREPIATKHIMNILSKDDVVLEIGANIGYYVLIESKLCEKIYAVEPVTENINNLKKNIALNNCKNVEVYQLAFGDTDGEKKIYISSKSNWHSFYQPKNYIGQENVMMNTVDNFIKDKKSPTIVRMDVEGYELPIIKGMEKTLSNVKKIFIEVHADITSLQETRELLDIIKKEKFVPELIIKYDRPYLGKILPNNYIEKLYLGDKGNCEIFFTKI